MSFIAAAVIGGVGAIAGGYISSQGAQGAAQTQANASQNAANLQLQEFNTITGQESPYMQGGYGALNALEYGLGIGGTAPGPGNPGTPPDARRGGGSNLRPMGDSGMGFAPQVSLGPGAQTGGAPAAANLDQGYGSLLRPFNASDWQSLSPAYNFQREQGQQGTLNMDSTNQGALSGAAQKDLMGFNQGLAQTSFGNAFNMYQTQQGNIYNRLAGLVQTGQNAAANTGQQGTALAGNAGQALTNVGTALGGGQIGAANAYAGALNNASTYAMAGYMNNPGQWTDQNLNDWAGL